MPLGSPRLAESGIELYADGAVRGSISTLQLSARAAHFFFGDAVPTITWPSLRMWRAMRLTAPNLMRSAPCSRERLGLPVLLGYGPRYMHSIGQLYKGGPASGMFLMITSQKPEDLAIPGAKYTFGQLEMAQALGDLQSLGRLGKPALRLHLTEGAPAGLASLRRVVDQALSASRSAI